MEPYVARAFLNKLLNDSERKDLQKQEEQGRYFLGFEICQKFHLKPEPLSEHEVDEMTRIYRVWQKKWECEYDRLRAAHPDVDGKPSFNVTGDDWLSDLRSWEYFARMNYVAPLPSLTGRVVSVLTWVGIGSLLARTLSQA